MGGNKDGLFLDDPLRIAFRRCKFRGHPLR
jgi:hypothetical protein